VRIAVLDACVLYQAALRDLFMHLTVHFVFQPKWTDQIHAEWIDNVLEHRSDLNRTQLERTRDLMNQWARDWSAPGYEKLISTLHLSDPDDRHVLAAAIAAQSSTIVTFNLRDFPDRTLLPFRIRAQHPDDFACDLFEKSPDGFVLSTRTHRASLKKPPRSVEEYLYTLAHSGLRKTAERLSVYRDSI